MQGCKLRVGHVLTVWLHTFILHTAINKLETILRIDAIPEPIFQADCTQCAALCCVALAFDRSDMFAIDKAAGQGCPNLAGNGQCRIHEHLFDKGFSGCVRYDCLGAGQRVTQEIFHGQSWQKDTALLPHMLTAFRIMRQIQELDQLLQSARKLPLSDLETSRRQDLCAALHPPTWDLPALEAFEQGAIPGEIRAFLKTLKPRARAGRKAQ